MVHACTEYRLQEDTLRRWPFASHGRKKPDHLTSSSGDFNFQTCEKLDFCDLRHWDCVKMLNASTNKPIYGDKTGSVWKNCCSSDNLAQGYANQPSVALEATTLHDGDVIPSMLQLISYWPKKVNCSGLPKKPGFKFKRPTVWTEVALDSLCARCVLLAMVIGFTKALLKSCVPRGF